MLCGIFSLKCQASQRQTSRRESGKSFGRLCIGLPLPQHAICGVVGRGDYGESQFGNQESLSPNSPWGSIWIDELLILSALSDTKAELDYTQLTMPVWRRDDDVGLVSGCPYCARQGCGRAREGHGWAGEGTNEYQWWVKTDIHVGAIPSSSLQIPGESHGWILY